jgi:hypothetical protein
VYTSTAVCCTHIFFKTYLYDFGIHVNLSHLRNYYWKAHYNLISHWLEPSLLRLPKVGGRGTYIWRQGGYNKIVIHLLMKREKNLLWWFYLKVLLKDQNMYICFSVCSTHIFFKVRLCDFGNDVNLLRLWNYHWKADCNPISHPTEQNIYT